MKTIIFVTDLTLWSMGKGHGGPAFNNTIDAYVTDGWDVYILSDVPSNAEYPMIPDSHNIVLQPTVFKKYILKRKIGLLFRFLDHIVMTWRFKKQIKVLLQKNENTVLYSYEIYGVRACKSVSSRYNIPFITRFQGTILTEYKNTLFNNITRYPHYQALSTESDLLIMTNDGTQGDRILSELHNDSKQLFLMNGLDLLDLDLTRMILEFDRDSFRSKKIKSASEDCVFLTVSRLVSWKRIDRAIDGFAEYCKTNKSGKLVIVGDGEARGALENRVKDHGIYERVLFVGSVPHDDVYLYMMACDVFLSLYDLSNVGNPLLEAMALGKCIITYDVGDTGKFVQNEKNGILLDSNSLAMLPKVMERLAEDVVLREMLGKSAAQYAKKHFWSWKDRMKYEVNEVNKLLANNESEIS